MNGLFKKTLAGADMRMICTRESSPSKIGKPYSGSFALVSGNMIKHPVILFYDGRFF